MTREAKGKKRRLPFKLSRLLMLLMIVWIGVSFGKNALTNHRLRQEIDSLEKRLVVLELRKEDLEREIEQWRSPENVERVAREQLGLVKPGEVVYRLSESVSGDVERNVEKRQED